ncbi:hypothetical protein GQR58_027285 [Nymphon striatum]|nr:hypothetical protein GQR58_027285 [Nymphon striatum]
MIKGILHSLGVKRKKFPIHNILVDLKLVDGNELIYHTIWLKMGTALALYHKLTKSAEQKWAQSELIGERDIDWIPVFVGGLSWSSLGKEIWIGFLCLLMGSLGTQSELIGEIDMDWSPFLSEVLVCVKLFFELTSVVGIEPPSMLASYPSAFLHNYKFAERTQPELDPVTSKLQQGHPWTFHSEYTSVPLIELASISTDKLATPDITEDVLHAHESGKKAYGAFKTDRLEQEPPARKFHDPMKKLNLNLTNLSVKKMKTTTHGKELVLKADRNVFAYMLLVAQSRKLKMEDVLSHPLGLLSMSLAKIGSDLESTQEEAADACMLLYAAHASRGNYEAIVVVSGDMDVLVLFLAFKPQIPTNMYLSQALLSFHAFTGCGMTSVFGGRGKLGPLKLLKSSQGHMNTFNTLGQDWILSPQALLCKEMKARITPNPTLCGLSLQTLLASKIIKQTYGSLHFRIHQTFPGPGGHGWKLDLSDPDGGFVLDWIERKPEIVLELLVCTCSSLCKIEK